MIQINLIFVKEGSLYSNKTFIIFIIGLNLYHLAITMFHAVGPSATVSLI